MLRPAPDPAILPMMRDRKGLAMWRTAGSWTVLLSLLAVLGCSEESNVQKLPIGSRCFENGNCGTSPYNCATAGYPGGYCQKDCATDGDCPSDSVCVAFQCRRKCNTTTDCRATEGYICDRSGPIPVCDIDGNPDGGTP
jgi:hypothetical protein